MVVCVCVPLCRMQVLSNVAVEGVGMERPGVGLQERRSSLSVGRTAKSSHVLTSWWHEDLALDRNISCALLPASTPAPSLSTASINDKSPRGL